MSDPVHFRNGDFDTPPVRPGMSAHELSRFVDFVAEVEQETSASLDLRPTTREVQIMVELMRSHLQGRLETPSSLIARSGLSTGSAHRVIEDMTERGLIVKRARTRSGKSFSLHPSEALIDRWLEYATRMKSILGTAFGLTRDVDYFFGASYMSSSIVPPLPILEEKLELRGGLRILIHADPTFLAMHKLKRQFEMHFGIEVHAHALTLDRLHREILENAQRPCSRYDIVTGDLCWMTELASRGAILPLDDLVEDGRLDIADFHPEAVTVSRYNGTLYGVPVQTTPELLIYREDLLADKGVEPPETLDELIAAARALHDPLHGVSGIAWNGGRGTPISTTFMMLMADLGRPVVNLPRAAGGYACHDPGSQQLRPMIDTETGHRAAELLQELTHYSPPNVLQMSWYERARCFAEGRAAMAYCYTQIMPLLQRTRDPAVIDNIGYLPHPTRAGTPRIAPLGGWSLCIPSNLPAERHAAARAAVCSLTSAAATKLYVENGSVVSSRFSVCNDPHVAEASPVIPIVDKMAREGTLQAWPRPAVPELMGLVAILGEEIHALVQGIKPRAAALADAQGRCEALLGSR